MNAFDIASEFAGTDTYKRGKDIVEKKRVYHILSSFDPSGSSVVFTAKVSDAFNFIDHPSLTLNASKNSVIAYSCDCTEYHNNNRFCIHCAALAKSIESNLPSENVSASSRTPIQVEQINEGAAPIISINDLAYKFYNSSADLYQGEKSPSFSLESFKMMFGDTAQAFALYTRNNAWGGSCFGFVSTSSMFYVDDNDIHVTDFSPDATAPRELDISNINNKWGIDLLRFIEGMQISQRGYKQVYERYTHRNSDTVLDEILDHVSQFNETFVRPISIGVYGIIDGKECGHAIFPYKVENANTNNPIIYIYDPNRSISPAKFLISKDENGKCKGWKFLMSNGTEFSSYVGGGVSYVTYETYYDDWLNRGHIDTGTATMYLSDEISVLDEFGNCVLKTTKTGVEAYRNDVVIDYPTDGAAIQNSYSVWLKPGAYQIKNDSLEHDGISMQFSEVNQLAVVSTTANGVTMNVCDQTRINSVTISQPDAHFTVRLYSTLSDTTKDIIAEGQSTDETIIAQMDGKLYLCGFKDLDTSRVVIDGTTRDNDIINGEKPQKAMIVEKSSVDTDTNDNE